MSQRARIRATAGSGASTIAIALLAGWLVFALFTAPAMARGYTSPGYKPKKVPAPVTPPKPPKALQLTASGRFPDLVVDDAGTAHVVWTEPGPDGADVVRYCRIKRATRGCDAQSTLMWAKAYGVGDAPIYNTDQNGPRILEVGSQLVVVDYRYPTVQEKPDGSNISATVLSWTSTDGGTTWTGPGLVGTQEISGGAVVYGGDDDPTILTATDTVTGGTAVQAIRPGVFTSASAVLGPGDQAYSGSLAVDGGQPVIAFADLGTRTFVRRLAVPGGALDPNAWTPPLVIPGDEPKLAGGPGGLFLMNRPSSGKPYVVRRINGASAGKAVTVATVGDGVGERTLAEDPSGRLHAAWATAVAKTPGAWMRSSADGRTWGLPQPMLSGANAGQLEIAAAADGGGMLVGNRDGGVNAPGELNAVPLGTTAPTGRPGLGGLPGGGDASATSTCAQIRFAAVHIDSAAGCFYYGKGEAARTAISIGEIGLNGLRIIPDPGTRIGIDARAHTINTEGKVRVVLQSGTTAITLYHDPLHLRLPSAGSGAKLFDVDASRFGIDVLGFAAAGKVEVFLTATGVRIPISLKLPSVFGGVTGSAVLRGERGRGLILDSLHFGVTEAPVGPLLLKKLAIDYDGAGEAWSGELELHLPPQPGGVKLAGKARFERGRFKSGEVTVTPPFPPGIVVAPGVWLVSVTGGFELDPVKITLGGAFGALPVGPGGPFTATVTGKASVSFGDPVTFTYTGTGAIFDIALTREEAVATTDGYVRIQGSSELDLKILQERGTADVVLDGPRKRFSGELRGQIKLLDHEFLGVKAVVSTEGLGGCYELAVVDLGFGYRWGDDLPSILFPSCDLSAYTPGTPVSGTPDVAAGATFTVPKGAPSMSVRVRGAGALPGVSLQDPSGAVVPVYVLPPGAADVPAGAKAVGLQTGADVLTIGIDKPAAGTWRLLPVAIAGAAAKGGRARAAAFSGVEVARGLPAPKVSATLRRRGRTRALRYRVTRRAGLVTRFVETGRGVSRELGTAKAAQGTLRIPGGDLPGGRRTITAVVTDHGVPRLRRTVATYTAPARTRPARPRRVRARRSGSAVVVRWSAAPHAAGYLVRVRAGGTRAARLVSGRKRSVRIGGLPRSGRITVSVAGRTRTGRTGPGRSARAR